MCQVVPGSVAADPRMLLTKTGEHKGQRKRMKELEGNKRGEQSQESVGERLLALHAPVSWLHGTSNGHKDKQKIVPFYF